MKRYGPILIAGLLFQAGSSLLAANVAMIEINGAIGPATAIYISRASQLASKQGDACLIIQLDTPGGLVSSTEEIVHRRRSRWRAASTA